MAEHALPWALIFPTVFCVQWNFVFNQINISEHIAGDIYLDRYTITIYICCIRRLAQLTQIQWYFKFVWLKYLDLETFLFTLHYCHFKKLILFLLSSFIATIDRYFKYMLPCYTASGYEELNTFKFLNYSLIKKSPHYFQFLIIF